MCQLDRHANRPTNAISATDRATATGASPGCRCHATPTCTAPAASAPVAYSNARAANDSSPDSTITVAAVRLLAPLVRNCRNAYAAEIAEPAGRLMAMADRL